MHTLFAVSAPQKSETCPDWGAGSSGGISFGEYLFERPRRGGERLCRNHAQSLRQSDLIHGANLIEQDQALSATVSETHPKRCLATGRSHRCDEYCAQMIVHLGRADHHTRACLPDFTPDSGIKLTSQTLHASPGQLRIVRITKFAHHQFVVPSLSDPPGGLGPTAARRTRGPAQHKCTILAHDKASSERTNMSLAWQGDRVNPPANISACQVQ
jgi:hypothetical protein